MSRLHRQRRTPARQRGVALLTAMLVVAMATILAADVLWEDHLQRRRIGNLLNLDQALEYGLGAEAWAADTLRIDLTESTIDHLGETWAIDLPPLPVDGGIIEGLVDDMQGRFNLNNLLRADGTVNETQLGIFQRLLALLELDPALATVVVDWLDPDVETSFPDGAEDDAYTGNDPPYRPGNGPVTSASELLAMQGIDAGIYSIVAPHVTALPIGTSINVNTATSAVLAALSENMSIIDAEALVQARVDTPFEGLDEFAGDVPQDVLQLLSDNTRFFQVVTRVSLGTTRFTMYSLLERDQSGAVQTMLRRFGAE